jgi:hypothetical protein
MLKVNRAQVGTATDQRTDGEPATVRRVGARRAEAHHTGSRRAGARLAEAPRRGGNTRNQRHPPTHLSSYGMGAHKTTGTSDVTNLVAVIRIRIEKEHHSN